MKTYLLKMNQYLETVNRIFPDMIKNCYVQINIFESYNQNVLNNIISRTLDHIYFDDNEINVDDCNNLVLEFISGNLVAINSNTNGATIHKFNDEHTIVESIDEIVLLKENE